MLQVVKLGGSLLAWIEVRAQLAKWLEMQSGSRTVLLVGGGELVDSIRTLDERHQLRPSVSHQMAVGAMSLTARMVAEWLPEFQLTRELEEIIKNERSRWVFDCQEWVFKSGLPESWDLTSDSISAALAEQLNADELVLLKSCLPSESVEDFVDPLFSRFAATSTIRVVNLKSKLFEEVAYPSFLNRF